MILRTKYPIDPPALPFESSLRTNPRFPWAYNDYAATLVIAAADRINRNHDPSEQIAKAIAFGRQDTALDANYLFAYNTILFNYILRTRWDVEHGKDPAAFLGEVTEVAAAALQINKKYIFTYGNLGEIFYYHSLHQSDAAQAIMPTLQLSIDHFAGMIAINKNIPQAYASLAFDYSLLASSTLAARRSASSVIDQGMAAIRQCYLLQSRFPHCQAAEAQLLAGNRLLGQRFGALRDETEQLLNKSNPARLNRSKDKVGDDVAPQEVLLCSQNHYLK